jgi:hypothetical protein
MAFSVSYVYEILDRYSAPIRKIQDRTKRFARTVQAAKIKVGALGRTLRKVGDKMSSVGKTMTTSITLVGAAFTIMALKASANMEQLEVSFGVMLGSMQKGKDMIKSLTDFAARTPFQLTGIGNATKRLLAFGFAQKQIMPSLNMLGDISAGTGKDLSELAVIYGQVKMAGRLMGQDFLQFVNAGVPVATELAKILAVKFGGSIEKNKARLKDFMSKGKISFGMVQQAMLNMTGEGGRFNGMMDKQSQTLGGLWSTVKDNAHLALVDFGNMVVKLFNVKGGLKGLIGVIQDLRERFKKWTDENPKLAKMALMATAIFGILGPILLILGPIVKLMGFLGMGIGALAMPIVLVVAGVALLILMFRRWASTNHPVLKSLKRLWQAMAPVGRIIGFLIDRLGALVSWLFGTNKEAGMLAHIFDVIGLALIPIIAGVTGLINLLFGESDGNVFAGMMADLEEFRKGTSMVSQVYDGMVRRVSEWITTVMNFFTMLKTEILDTVDKITSITSVLAKTGMFGGIVQSLSNKTGEKTGDNKSQEAAQKQKVEISGRIGVSAGGGAKVEEAGIGLNQGANLATVM